MAHRKKRKLRADRLAVIVIACIAVIVAGVYGGKYVLDSFGKKNDVKSDAPVVDNGDEIQEEKETVISLVGVGDNLIHETVYLDAQKEDGSFDFTKMYANVKDDIQSADIAFINQETVLGGEELGLAGYPCFNSPVEIAQNLKDTGFTLANIASNHTLDRFQAGIDATRKAFEDVGITVDGAYSSQEQFDTIPVFETKGVKFSFLAYTYGTNGIEPENPWSISYFDENQILSDVARAKEISDVVIVSAHWGDEHAHQPNDFQTYYAQLFADLGVDLVIGTHTHSIQPVEWVTGKNGNRTLVIYSLGNFIGGMLTENNAIGGMIRLDIVQKNDAVTIENVKWTPTIIHFEGDQNNILDVRYNYQTYKLSQYTDELAAKHVLNGYDGEVVSVDSIRELTESVIAPEFLDLNS
ncbi:MAG: CapA family protein [Bulleidia sp.]